MKLGMLDSIDLFLSRVALRPQSTAVSVGDALVTYAALEQRARRIATLIAQQDGTRVLLALPQGPDAYAAMIGIGLGGGYYAPVNIAAPTEKLRSITRELAPDLVLCNSDNAALLATAAPAARIIDVGQLDSVPVLHGHDRRHDIAYIIFTSGSTGKPKGVVISRPALNHYVTWLVQELALGPQDKISQHPNIGFDLSVLDIYGALSAGATLCPIVSKGDRLLPARAVARMGITAWVSVPSVVGLMMQANQATAANLRSVRLFIFCGEPLLREHLDALFSACPEAVVLNTYGPTEATVSMTSLRLTSVNYRDACSDSVAIGAPIADMSLHLIGGQDDDEGQIVISGPQLATAYWRDPERTDEAFRTIDVNGTPTRAYFTGDWAQRCGGHLFWRGRLDSQTKILGHRLELDEVAAAIRALGWLNVCVVALDGQLVAVIEAADQARLDEEHLRRCLAEKLEAHAIPTAIRAIPSMPRNDNDKIDRHAVIAWLKPHGDPGAQVASRGRKADAKPVIT